MATHQPQPNESLPIPKPHPTIPSALIAALEYLSISHTTLDWKDALKLGILTLCSSSSKSFILPIGEVLTYHDLCRNARRLFHLVDNPRFELTDSHACIDPTLWEQSLPWITGHTLFVIPRESPGTSIHVTVPISPSIRIRNGPNSLELQKSLRLLWDDQYIAVPQVGDIAVKEQLAVMLTALASGIEEGGVIVGADDLILVEADNGRDLWTCEVLSAAWL